MVDLITTSEKSVSLAVSALEETTTIKQAAEELEKLGTMSI